MPDLREHLQNLFGLDDFRTAQREVIEEVLRGNDVLCVMPTGAGKSLCYQLPAAISDGLSIVVSPLISLMEDQVQQLRDANIPAVFLNSTLSAALRRQVMEELAAGFSGMLYVAPERFFASDFAALMPRLKPGLFAIDEAHCVSQWGHDFRPEYSRLADIRRQLGSPPCIALTTTATEDVRDDIIRHLELRDPEIVITGFDRPNLSYQCRRAQKNVERIDELLDLVQGEPGGTIVYCATRKAVDEVTALLAGTLRDRPIFAYHAGMDPAARTANQERFMNTPRAVAVATNAFGMGINKPDIRLVVHFNIPGTLEAYYQEAGRAGRDGLPARCVLIFSYQDKYTQDFFIEKIGQENPDADPKRIAELKQHATIKLDLMVRYAQTHRCRRQMILDYFGDEMDVTDCRCDVCRRDHSADDGGKPAQLIFVNDEVVLLCRQLLSAIARLNGKFGVGVVAEVLAGSETDKTARWGFNQLSVYGLLRQFPLKRLVSMLHRMVESGLARQRDPDGTKFRPVIELTAAGVAVMKGEQLPPSSLADLLPRRGASGSPDAPHRGDRSASRQAQVDSADLDSDASRRFDRLRAVRTRIAREKNLPPYVICHDSTLKLIATAAPADEAGLEQVKGMGPYKVKLYGQALLSALEE